MNTLCKARRRLRAWRLRLLSLLGYSVEPYDPAAFWEDRHIQFGFDIRGVGNIDLTVEENERMYREAKAVMYSVWDRESIDCQQVRLLDIGCGQGFYAEAFRERGGRRYLGIDIADALLPALRRRYPQFDFLKLDVCSQEIPGEFGVILMIDVTQHILDENKFQAAMLNVRSHLAYSSVFVVTSSLARERARRGLHVVDRPLSAYQDAFPGYKFSHPVPFRDKFLFTIRR